MDKTEEQIYNELCSLLPQHMDPRPKSSNGQITSIEAILRIVSKREILLRNELKEKYEKK